MGAAIECFPAACAVCVPRSRFAPVKKCSDLLLLRSDAYLIDPLTSVLVLNPKCNNTAPVVDLDEKKYKLVEHLEAATRDGYPSLVGCLKLSVVGEVILSSRNVFRGKRWWVADTRNAECTCPHICSLRVHAWTIYLY